MLQYSSIFELEHKKSRASAKIENITLKNSKEYPLSSPVFVHIKKIDLQFIWRLRRGNIQRQVTYYTLYTHDIAVEPRLRLCSPWFVIDPPSRPALCTHTNRYSVDEYSFIEIICIQYRITVPKWRQWPPTFSYWLFTNPWLRGSLVMSEATCMRYYFLFDWHADSIRLFQR